ncbi:MnhB domain-containing protein [Pelobacter seleniigenes]|uniref:MnhB domain-containing protein n=1 Tax=Pelobacter seleniigenes TaxID=407188 RepID=UPI001B802EAA|nr:MnhB domain-containing protein [Pelobacter seleniigenes]
MKLLQERTARQKLGESLIIQTAVRMLVPFIQLFGLYVIVHGHYSPGGGFQGGVILGASFVVLSLAFDQKFSMHYMSEKTNGIFGNIGALIYTGTAALCAIMGGMFLDYSALDKLLPLGPIEWRSLGIFIVEVGVGLAVMSIMTALFWVLGSKGEMDEGL